MAKLRSCMYKIYHNMVPEYLKEILPNIRSNESNYVTRYSHNYCISKCRLNIYKSYFVTREIHEWNSLPLEIRQSTTLSSFRNCLQLQFYPSILMFLGDRYWNVIHTRLRHSYVLNIAHHRQSFVYL